jgi:hypothetical protein
LNGTDLKKTVAALIVVLLVFVALHARDAGLHAVPVTRLSGSASQYSFLPTPNFTHIECDFLQSIIEICPQSYTQRSEFKKTLPLICNQLFQSSPFFPFNYDLLLKKGVSSSTPLYISHCNMLI